MQCALYVIATRFLRKALNEDHGVTLTEFWSSSDLPKQVSDFPSSVNDDQAETVPTSLHTIENLVDNGKLR